MEKSEAVPLNILLLPNFNLMVKLRRTEKNSGLFLGSRLCQNVNAAAILNLQFQNTYLFIYNEGTRQFFAFSMFLQSLLLLTENRGSFGPG